MCHNCATILLGSNFKWAVIDKKYHFLSLPHIWYTHKNLDFLTIFGKRLVEGTTI